MFVPRAEAPSLPGFYNQQEENPVFSPKVVKFLEFIRENVLVKEESRSFPSSWQEGGCIRQMPAAYSFDNGNRLYGVGNQVDNSTHIHNHYSDEREKKKEADWAVVLIGSGIALWFSYLVGSGMANLEQAEDNCRTIVDFNCDLNSWKIQGYWREDESLVNHLDGVADNASRFFAKNLTEAQWSLALRTAALASGTILAVGAFYASNAVMGIALVGLVGSGCVTLIRWGYNSGSNRMELLKQEIRQHCMALENCSHPGIAP